MGPSAANLLIAVPAAAEASKVPFYVAGAILVGWAIVLSVTGLRRPDFPGSPGRGRAVVGISVVLVVCTLALAVATSSLPGGKEGEAVARGSSGGPGAPLRLAADPSGRLAFDRGDLSARAGRVTIDFTNRSRTPHNVTLAQGSRTIAGSRTITGSRAALTTTLKPGTYTFFCSVDGHRQGGMRGTLTVK